MGTNCCLISNGVRAIKGIRPREGVDITPRESDAQKKYHDNKKSWKSKSLSDAVAIDDAGDDVLA